jgi:predicted RNase H-like HicB family nuclease
MSSTVGKTGEEILYAIEELLDIALTTLDEDEFDELISELQEYMEANYPPDLSYPSERR